MESPQIAALLRNQSVETLAKVLMAIDSFNSFIRKISLLSEIKRKEDRKGDYDWADKFLNELSDLRKV